MERRRDLGSRIRAYFELELTHIQKMIPEAGHEFSWNRWELAGTERQVCELVV